MRRRQFLNTGAIAALTTTAAERLASPASSAAELGPTTCHDGDNLFAIAAEHRIERRTPAGELRWSYDAAGAQSGSLNHPTAAVEGPDARVYVANHGNSEIVVLSATGALAQVIGSFGSGPGQLSGVRQLAFGPDSLLYAADCFNHRIVVFTPAGDYLHSLGNLGSSPDEFNGPYGVAFDADGLLHVADRGNARVVVRRVDGSVVAIHRGREGCEPRLGHLFIGEDGHCETRDTITREAIRWRSRRATRVRRPSLV
jgi:DNA-binding beta-propeller fold protein YncE